MAGGQEEQRRHILLGASGAPERFTSPLTGGGGTSNYPTRDREIHADGLLNQLNRVATAMDGVAAERAEQEVTPQEGMIIEFEAAPDFDLALDSLDAQQQGVELLAVKDGSPMRATAFVPHGSLGWLEKRIVEYRDEDTITGVPKHQPLVATLAAIRRAALETLWTDDEAELPAENVPIWWEVWLRVGGDRDRLLDEFTVNAARLELKVHVHQRVDFLDRTVVLAWGSRAQMTSSVALLDCIAELRRAKELAGEYFDLPGQFVRDLSADLAQRVQLATQDPPAVCLLDSGVNPHPLLEPFLAERGTVLDPALGVHDQHGHGTQMAGIALFGPDLADALATSAPITAHSVIESVKLWHAGNEEEPELYGHLTAQAAYTAETHAAQRQRALCLTVTTRDSRDRGRPSSWSARVDQLIAESIQGEAYSRLLVVSAGNVTDALWRHGPYPDVNHADGIRDPAQAWNALTVGACTHKVVLDQVRFPGWEPVAPAGRLSPTSTTSLSWDRAWPLKPDVVLEGGNVARVPGADVADTADDLRLLTTSRNPLTSWFTTTGDTSAAAAQGARLCAAIQGAYPGLWPETVRALVVHSANWTPQMIAEFGKDRENRVRCYGHGVPNLERALWSGRDHLTLIVEDELTPFRKESSGIKTNEMSLHTLPWPQDVLEGLGSTQVELRVTLSYFIEPNPARRGWRTRFVYPSHQLRFDVRRAQETTLAFRSRINKAARSEARKASKEKDPGWALGPTLRHRGCLHQDVWKGIAGDLAARGVIAVYPAAGGWWRSRPKSDRWNSVARYALVVSIRTPDVAADVDIYTAVASQLPVPVEVMPVVPSG